MDQPPPFAPQAVVFDLDGVLVDTEQLWGRAERRLVESFGVAWDPALRPRLLGRGPADAALVLAEHVGLPDRADLVEARLQEAAVGEFRSRLEPRPGARPLVTALVSHMPLAVATNSRRALAELSLGVAGFADCFAAVVSADEVDDPKPAAGPYAAACRRLGVEPGRTVAIEDSPVGVASAKTAGLWVVGCPSLPGEDMGAADALVRRLDDIDPARLAAGR
ncbi:MAG: HAD family phosphatase [Actinomycetota bacterium]|nr:HAD family phosphatase [Actinomycetota bacterium]